MTAKKSIGLSYVMTTYNKLGFIKTTLPLLIAACGPDEEIVVTDGGSTDGTTEYLEALYKQKKIHKYISEKDKGEAHGTNKAMIMSEGELIKIITDDDIFHFPSIQVCKEHMLKNPQIDILGFDGFGYNTNLKGKEFERTNYSEGFIKWKADKTPFLFCGLSYMIRKSSLAYLGLFNSNFKIIDIEYSVRVSSMKANIAFYSGLAYVNIVNPDSNSHKFYNTIDEEKIKLTKIYPGSKKIIALRSLELRTKEFISGKVLKRKPKYRPFNYEKIVADANALLEKHNNNKTFEFI